MSKPIIRLVTCGSVDDGKSTLIGRLLVETDSVPHDTVAAARNVRRSGSTIVAGDIDFSLLTDGLEAEREQGITIDVAYRSMSLLNGRRLIIADAPGHEQYTRNMAVAASRADVALVLVDAARGIRTQTLRHLTICSLMGVARVAVVVNKLDAVDYDEAIYNAIVDELSEVAKRLEILDYMAIPVSALVGDNVINRSENMPWYDGPTLLEYIQTWNQPEDAHLLPHMGVQLISRTENFRGLSGTVLNGTFNLGDEIVVLPSKRKAKISKILTYDGEIKSVGDSETAIMVLEPDVDATRGDSIQLASNFINPADRFKANLVWLGDTELIQSRSYYLISGSMQIPATVTSIKYRLDVNSGEHDAADLLQMNEIGVVEIATDSPISLNTYKNERNTGSFILVDRVTLNTVAAGMVIHALRRSENVTEHRYEIDALTRAAQKNQSSKVIWLTGLSGSGKSTIANELEKQLFANGLHSYVLDGDNLRHGINKDLGFTKADRAENVRRVAHIAQLMSDAGLIVIVALISPFSTDRDSARALFEPGKFLEVWVKTPTEVCIERDPKGLYKKATSGSIPNMTGIGQEYEAPESAELVLDGTIPVLDTVKIILETIL
uniref:adenylyl-sulfate kinase n=3 Tax=Candidatus Planktophila sp. TaxID=2175601 RepID=UPI004048ED4B